MITQKIKSICRNGHEVSNDKNAYIDPKGYVYCRTCMKLLQTKYVKSGRRKQVIDKYMKSKKGIIAKAVARKNYMSSELGKKAIKKYHKSIQYRNHCFINNAIALGKLIKNNICVDCGKKTNTEIHHEKYHDPPQLIDIAEVCKDCHSKRTKKGEGYQ